MNEDQQLIIETTRRIFTDLCSKEVVDQAEAGTFPDSLWQTLSESGLVYAGLSESAGGSGGTLADSLLVLKVAGEFAAPVPIAETFIAGYLLGEAGEMCPEGKVAVSAGAFTVTDSGIELANPVPVTFAPVADAILFVGKDNLALVSASDVSLSDTGSTLAGEPVATVSGGLPAKVVSLEEAAVKFEEIGAICRSCQMAGAMQNILGMSVEYSVERSQFGRAISKFQAVQQMLAVLAGEVAACQRAADSLLYSQSRFDVAIARARINDAVVQVAEIAHQVHGAMGYTQEHGLNHRTRRLWQWRDEFGSEMYWQEWLGGVLCDGGADQLWPAITNAG